MDTKTPSEYNTEVTIYIFFPMDSRQALAFIGAYGIAKSEKWKVKKNGVLGEEMGGSAKSIRSLFHTRKGPFINYVRMILAIFYTLYPHVRVCKIFKPLPLFLSKIPFRF